MVFFHRGRRVMRPSVRRRTLRWLLLGALTFVLLVLGANRWVINSTKSSLYRDVALLPQIEVGLILGTSHRSRTGGPNKEFEGRLRAAAELYHAGKVKHLIVSGANPDETYNEPRQMRRGLVALGVPGEDITMDFAGFRTFDSIVRAQTVWGLPRYTVITHHYHAPRAIFIARQLGVRNSVAYLARVGSTEEFGRRDPMREILARFKAVLDIYILNTQPKFRGEPEGIAFRPPPPDPDADLDPEPTP